MRADRNGIPAMPPRLSPVSLPACGKPFNERSGGGHRRIAHVNRAGA